MNRQDYYNLAPYAARDERSRGRKHDETFNDGRPHFERDRDRVIHCAAFRRLEYKTQVFVNHEGDYYRTRLTHSIEVAQIARGIAKQLGLNVDLAETLSLAHDLGHTPFGHVGERILNALVLEAGEKVGFEHNRQSLRIVTELEERYPEFPGLNLTWESREGIVKHHTSYDDAGDDAEFAEYDPDKMPTLEAQIINLADEIAYHNHDLDDGTESGLITFDQLREISLWRETEDSVSRRYPDLSQKILKHKTVSTLIGRFISDLVVYSEKRIAEAGVKDLADVRDAGDVLIAFSPEFFAKRTELRDFLKRELYDHPHLQRMRFKAERTVRKLYDAYASMRQLLPPRFVARIETDGMPRVICDYIAGMTDRFALDEYRRLYDPRSLD